MTSLLVGASEAYANQLPKFTRTLGTLQKAHHQSSKPPTHTLSTEARKEGPAQMQIL
jgi:hypothetical protein